MDAAAIKGRSAGSRALRIRGPLVGSAAAHLLLLALFLLVGASVDTHVERVVPVILVEGATLVPSGTEESVTGSSAAPPAPTGSSSAAGRISPRSSAPAPPDDTATPPPSTARLPSSNAATLSAEPVPVPSRRNAGAGSTTEPRSGATLSEIGEAPAGRVPAGTGTAGTAGRGDRGHPGGSPGNGQLREKIESAIVYPDEAVRRGLEGEVLLRIRIGAGGSPGDIHVAKSSGARILDEAARRGVVRAAPLPSDPGWVEVPVRFVLRRPAGERP